VENGGNLNDLRYNGRGGGGVPLGAFLRRNEDPRCKGSRPPTGLKKHHSGMGHGERNSRYRDVRNEGGGDAKNKKKGKISDLTHFNWHY